ncbi:DUF3435 domain-containing protein [Halomonas organivorans]|uniref:DUF3435 domain-containing protein n=1 Tax=Halomonas organivorans TaxID=257772 RepID=UPI003628ECA8
MELQLSLSQTFVKREATTADVIIILRTPWISAVHVPCSAEHRQAFHTVVLFSGLGGFRPDILMRLKYRQVRFSVLRDPRDKRKTHLMVTVWIKQNKRAEFRVKEGQTEMYGECLSCKNASTNSAPAFHFPLKWFQYR